MPLSLHPELCEQQYLRNAQSLRVDEGQPLIWNKNRNTVRPGGRGEGVEQLFAYLRWYTAPSLMVPAPPFSIRRL